MGKNLVSRVAGVLVATAMCFSSTVAAAATVPAASAQTAMSISPFVALSAYGTMQSRDAVCAAAVGAAGVAAAAEGQATLQGCVLPLLDPAAPVAAQTAPAVGIAPVASPGFGLGIGALLAGLVLVAGLAAVLLSGNGNDDRLPISPD